MFEIKSQFGSYRVDELNTVEEAVTSAFQSTPDGTFVLADAKVASLHTDLFQQVVDPRRIQLVEASEEAKSFTALEPVICSLLEAGIRRNSSLVVVGGGVLQDIGCFIGSILFRGLSCSLIPSTLLAQCDSCIGSKSSVNVGRYKNQLGTFHAPRHVYLVFDLLNTLPDDEIRSGMGEIIKLHLVAGQDEFARLKDRLTGYSRDRRVLEQLIRDSLHIKKFYIEQDEMDTGKRNLLNYGHTFGHAYESATHYGIPHGIAVALGISTATYFSERLGMVPAGAADEVDELLQPWYHPYDRALQRTDPEVVLSAMRQDKKNNASMITCILTRGPGAMEKVPFADLDQVRGLLADYYRRLGG